MNLRPKKRLGQHFLMDQRLIQASVDAMAIQADDHWIEIGPGQGALTQALLGQCRFLDLVEIDGDCVEWLSKWIENKHSLSQPINQTQTQTLRMHQQDILKLPVSSVFMGQKMRIVGNLPYYVSTPILFYLMDHLDKIQDIHVLLQKEVVERITAKPGSSAYSRLTVMIQSYCQATAFFDAPPQAFYPAPKVHSTYLRLQPHPEPIVPPDCRALFSAVVKEAFQHRRKTLSNSLKARMGSQIPSDFSRRRPQELTVAEFLSLAQACVRCDISDLAIGITFADVQPTFSH